MQNQICMRKHTEQELHSQDKESKSVNAIFWKTKVL